MSSLGSLKDLCCYVLDYEDGQYTADPVGLGTVVREYASMQRTPSLARTIKLVRALGIKIEAVEYLNGGGTNMTAKGNWYIHFSAREKPATQKFTIFHELFEIIHKNIAEIDQDQTVMKEPQLSRCADRFAASVLIPPNYFLRKSGVSGCDLVQLGSELELSHQCLLIALEQHYSDIPMIGALYEYSPNGAKAKGDEISDYKASVVVKTPKARRVKRRLCGYQGVPVRNSHPLIGSLVCAAITGKRPLLWRSIRPEEFPAILVRPLVSSAGDPYRVILLVIPDDEFGMIYSQVERIEPIAINETVVCPSSKRCRRRGGCGWKSGGYR